MQTDHYSLEQYVEDLRRIMALECDEEAIVLKVRPLAGRLAMSPGWLSKTHWECDEAQGFGVHLLHEEPNHDLAIFAMAWLPGRGTRPHNHKTWGVVAGVHGKELEIDWRRLDDGRVPGHARLERNGESLLLRGDVTCCLSEDIHAVRNIGDEVSLSLHTYGRHVNFTGRSEFDPEMGEERPYVLSVAAPAIRQAGAMA